MIAVGPVRFKVVVVVLLKDISDEMEGADALVLDEQNGKLIVDSMSSIEAVDLPLG